MFETDLNVLPRLTFQVGPQGYLARFSAQQKTDVFAVAGGANVRYGRIRRIGQRKSRSTSPPGTAA